MVQITEYTHRENPQTQINAGMNLDLPTALTEPGKGTKALSVLSESAKDLAGAYVSMKERRDSGIVAAFMNQFDKDSTAKILQLKEENRGQDANKIMGLYQEWRDKYIADHSFYDPERAEAGVVYLENSDQTNSARQKLDNYNVRDINNLSAYIADEEEKFRVNNLNASILNETQSIVNDDNMENIEISKLFIEEDLAELHKGQSEDYTKTLAAEIFDTALSGNIMRDAASNPIAAISRFQNEQFTKDMKTETRTKLKEELIKNFITNQAQQAALASVGVESNPAGQAFYDDNKSFFGNREGAIKAKIQEEALKLRNDILANDNNERTALLNDYTVQLLNAQDQGDEEKTAQTLTSMLGIRGGVETANMIKDVEAENNDFEMLMRAKQAYDEGREPVLDSGNLVPLKDEVDERLTKYQKQYLDNMDRVNDVVHGINTDKYETLSDIKGFNEFAPRQKSVILTAFANRARYKSLSETAKKDSGIDFDNRIRYIYKTMYGDPEKNPVLFGLFEHEMSQQIVRF